MPGSAGRSWGWSQGRRVGALCPPKCRRWRKPREEPARGPPEGGGRRKRNARRVSRHPTRFPSLSSPVAPPPVALAYPWGPSRWSGWALSRPLPQARPERQSGPGPTVVACGRWTRRFRRRWGPGGTPRPFPVSRAAGVGQPLGPVGGRAPASAPPPRAPFEMRPQIRRGDPLNLSILVSGGKETNEDSLSNGE